MTTPPVSDEPKKLETSAAERELFATWTVNRLKKHPDAYETLATKIKCDIDALLAENSRLRSGSLAQEGHKLDTSERVFFYEQEFYVLSNFSAFNLKWDNRTFPTSEHAYHYEKFVGYWGLGDADGGDAWTIAKQIMDAPSAHNPATTFGLENQHELVAMAYRRVVRVRRHRHDRMELAGASLVRPRCVVDLLSHHPRTDQPVYRVGALAGATHCEARPMTDLSGPLARVTEATGPFAWIVRLRYGSDRWSGEMFTDILPADDRNYQMVRPLYTDAALQAARDDEAGKIEAWLRDENIIAVLANRPPGITARIFIADAIASRSYRGAKG